MSGISKQTADTAFLRVEIDEVRKLLKQQEQEKDDQIRCVAAICLARTRTLLILWARELKDELASVVSGVREVVASQGDMRAVQAEETISDLQGLWEKTKDAIKMHEAEMADQSTYLQVSAVSTAGRLLR